MLKQLSFVLPEIDRKATQQAVEEAIEQYRLCLLTVPEERLPQVTARFSLELPTFTNQFHSSTEEIAVDRVDEERRRMKYVEFFRKAVNRLSPREREALILRYLEEDERFDYEVYNILGMSESYYHQKFKPRIFYKLALALKLEVFKPKEEGNGVH
ncbi:ArpU family phage packaging/lysis transcriptional regulator [Niallia taxi]|uniref:ArpU family transcriptional regulator n=1 Tax=Niallia taxi TaxID=2499688 RepID=A0A437KHY2_9BACI|nr:ArpU family phage packaging/lysis transcriptional regulator [Niallia taxi]RVT67675.1 ArpU family transcriptional regulator [Niallia taxi]